MRRMGPRLKRKLKKAAAAYVKRLETGNTKGQRKARQRSHPRMVGPGPVSTVVSYGAAARRYEPPAQPASRFGSGSRMPFSAEPRAPVHAYPKRPVEQMNAAELVAEADRLIELAKRIQPLAGVVLSRNVSPVREYGSAAFDSELADLRQAIISAKRALGQ